MKLDYNKVKIWNGKDLKGEWDFTYKIDGVRMLRGWRNRPVSRSNKPLNNLEFVDKDIKDAEIFIKDWGSTLSAVTTKKSVKIDPSCVYLLEPLDERLFSETVGNPTRDFILIKLSRANDRGFEGLVLRQGDRWVKVKPSETYDVEVLELIEGNGILSGKLGAVVTSKGKVSSGFSIKERESLWNSNTLQGSTIEVSCLQLTDNGLFRHPVFKRIRTDK